MRFEIQAGGRAELDELADLWQQMLAHHRRVVGERFPVRDAADSWAKARCDYDRWLCDGDAMLLVARNAESSRSLVVADRARGSGIGTALLEAIRADLLERGVEYWSVGVLVDNVDAERLYRRLGFEPWNQSLLAKTR